MIHRVRKVDLREVQMTCHNSNFYQTKISVNMSTVHVDLTQPCFLFETLCVSAVQICLLINIQSICLHSAYSF